MLQTLQHWSKIKPDSIAMEQGEITMSYAALWQAVNARSATLQSLSPHAIGIALADGLEWVIAHLACLHSSIPQVPLPSFFTPEQRTHALRDAGADLLITDEGMEWVSYASVALPAQTAIITYTSGSTGSPKGVCLSAGGMRAVAQSLMAMLGNEAAQRHLSVLPLAVLLEQVGGLYATLLAGGTYVFAGVQQNPIRLAAALASQRITSCILVPELLKLLVRLADQGPYDFSALRFVAVGGARVAPTLLQQAHRLALPVYEGYGLTESASVVAVNTPASHRAGTVGRLLPHVQATIAEDGEIILRHPAMLGYAGGTVSSDLYATGDLGAFDVDGFLTLTGRKKNLLITAHGRNVAPEWPESLLLAQPEIAQALVYGDGDATLSALIVPADQPSDKALKHALACANAQLPPYAQIEHWQCVPTFTPANGMATGNGRLRRDTILHAFNLKDDDHEFFRTAR